MRAWPCWHSFNCFFHFNLLQLIILFRFYPPLPPCVVLYFTVLSYTYTSRLASRLVKELGFIIILVALM